MQSEVNHPDLRELDQRSGDGFEVTLLWSERTGFVFVRVEDERMRTGFHFAVDPADALDAFHHPYAYSLGEADRDPRAPVSRKGTRR